MRVGILGSGLMGGKLGTIFARAGQEVVFSYARHKEKLEGLVRDAGGNARAGTPAVISAAAAMRGTGSCCSAPFFRTSATEPR